MRLALRTRLSKALFAAACGPAIAAYVVLAATPWRAERYSRQLSRAPLQKAAHLEPGNARHHYRLGRYALFAEQDAAAATASFRRAVELNPHDARYWLQLAAAYAVSNQPIEQRQALERALDAEPAGLDVAWEAGNFFVARGENEAALRQFAVVLRSAPDPVSVLDICWRATRDVERIHKLVASSQPAAAWDFLHLLVSKNEAEAAAAEWPRLVALHPPLRQKTALDYVRYLLDRRQVAPAAQVWRDLAELEPRFRIYLPGDSGVVNPGFDEELLNGGFDWRYYQVGGASATLDSTTFHGGWRSLGLSFDGSPSPDFGISQLVAVEPNARYRISAYAMGEGLLSAHPPRLEVRDAVSDQPLFAGDDLLGSFSWKTIGGEFRTGQDTRLVLLRLSREGSMGGIRGRLWLDDVSVVRQ